MPKLYIETVGCQMNMLDSELVVASLRKQGYELVADAGKSRHDPVQHVQRPAACRRQDLQRPGPAEACQEAAIPRKIIGVLGCMAQKDQRLIFERAPYVDLIVGPGQLHQIPELLSEIAAGSGPRMEVSLDRAGRQPRRGRAQLRKLRSAARPADASLAVPGVRADHDRLRQVLHVLHRAEGARARAEPAGGRHRGRGPPVWPTKAAAKSRCWARP